MKKAIAMLIAVACVSSIAFAAVKPAAVAKVTKKKMHVAKKIVKVEKKAAVVAPVKK